jgi:hypothetical protein
MDYKIGCHVPNLGTSKHRMIFLIITTAWLVIERKKTFEGGGLPLTVTGLVREA